MSKGEARSRTFACPSCAAPMQRCDFDRKPQGRVELDLCFECQAIWFDQYESAQLTPGSTVELFRAIHQNRDATPRPVSENACCPVCRARLKLTHDLQRTNRIVYNRCPEGHGRLTTFFQFLREKEFVRSLSDAEVARLRATVAQVRCSSCGAPVDLARDAQCGYCRAPISILDADAVQKTLVEPDTQELRRTQMQPGAIMDALLASKRFETQLARIEHASLRTHGMVDLIDEALGFLLS